MTCKMCTKCGKVLNLSFFGLDKWRKDGLTYNCKSCKNKQYRVNYHKNPEIYKRGNDKQIEYRKKYYNQAENKEKLRKCHLKSKFNLTHEDYIIMLARQKGVCSICKKFRTSKNKKYMNIDHCHETGKIRGVLCTWCNKALGLLDDDIEILNNAIKYLGES